MKNNKEKKDKVKCPKCGHVFNTKSKNLVSCNICGSKFRKDGNLLKVKDQRELK